MKTDEQEVINFLLTTEIIPLCLRIMESGSELSKTVCAFNLMDSTLCWLFMVYRITILESYLAVSTINISLFHDPAVPLSGIYTKEMSSHTHQHMYKNVYSSFTYKG